MPTGDGLIARLLPADGVLTIAALAALCDAARAFGNGFVEVTQRGSLQLRGIRPDTVAPLEAEVEAAGATPPPGPPVHVGPLAGLDPAETADPRPLAAALRSQLATIGVLPPKLAVVVDGGGRWPLDGLAADLRLTAVRVADGVLWRLETDDGGGAPPLSAAAAIDAVCAHVTQMAESGRQRPRPRVPRPPVGRLLPVDLLLPQESGASAAGIALPFGVTDASSLAALSAAAEMAGAEAVRLAPGHGLIFIGKSGDRVGAPVAGPLDAAILLAASGHLGFVIRPDDPRLALAVCAGAPACASGEAPTRPLADAVVAAAAALIAAGGEIHLSGCAKGCARAAPAALTIVGQPGGGYALVEGGTAGDATGEAIEATHLPAAVAAASRSLAAKRRTRDSGAARDGVEEA